LHELIDELLTAKMVTLRPVCRPRGHFQLV
jgi:hypothetical protein